MKDSLNIILDTIIENQESLSLPFWQDWGFGISTMIGGFSVFFSWIAFVEAKKAKEAAYEAGKTVKVQTVTIELTELLQGLDSLNPDISFIEARDLISKVNRRVLRLLPFFKSDSGYQEACENIESSLNESRATLSGLVPSQDNEDLGISIYHAIEADISKLSGQIAGLTGLLESRTIENN